LEGSQLLGETEPSPFSHYLVEGLTTGAAVGRAEWVTYEALFNYVYEQVRRSWPFCAGPTAC